MNPADKIAQQQSGAVARTRRYLYALLALNLAITGLIAAFFWYHQRVQDQLFDRVVRYHSAVGHAAQSSLFELQSVFNALSRRTLAGDSLETSVAPVDGTTSGNEVIAGHISALAAQRQKILSLQHEVSNPQFPDATDSAVKAFAPILLIGTPDDPARGNFSAQLEAIETLASRLKNLMDLHSAEQDRLTASGPHHGWNHPEYLIAAVGLLAVFGLAAGIGVIRSVMAANLEREAAFYALRQNERSLKHLADGLEAAQRIARIGNWEWDAEAGTEWWSDENYRIVGYKPGTAVANNETFFAAIHEHDRKKVAGLLDEAERNTCPYQVDFRVVLADGEVRYAREIGEPTFDSDGNFAGQRGTIQDITEQYQAEARLAEAVRRLEAAQRIARVADWEWDPDSGYLDWPPQMHQVLGLPPSDEPMDDDAFIARLHPDDREVLLRKVHRAIDHGESYAMEYRFLAPDGRTKVIMEYGEPFTPADPGKTRLRGTVQDVTETRRRERELRQTRERFSLAFQLSPSATAISEVETGIHVDVNDKWVEILGHPREEAIGRTAAQMGIWANPEDRDRAISLLKKDGRFRDFEAQYRTRRGDLRDFLISAEPFPVGDRQHMLIVGYDITERKRIERELRGTKERLEEAQHLGQMGSWTWDPEEDVEWWSDEHYRIFGLQPGSTVLDGFSFLKYVHPDDRERVDEVERHAAETLTPFAVEYRVLWPDGTERMIAEHGEWIEDDIAEKPQWRGIVQDITDRKRTEQELAQLNAELEQRVEERTAELRAAQGELVKRERLATLGQLTATVSHELRNPLGAMRTSLYVVEKRTAQEDSRLAEALGRINRSITRCDNIIDELLDFTRMRDLWFEQTSLDKYLAALLAELPVPEGISVREDFHIGDVPTGIDPDRMRRAVINLYENACQAMKPNGKATGADIDREHSLSITTRLNGNRAEIIFEDTGPGIPEEQVDRIFEPLFSTKNFGVGLGLPIVQQIMKQHGGGVEVRNRRNHGARFVLWLPLDNSKPAAEASATSTFQTTH